MRTVPISMTLIPASGSIGWPLRWTMPLLDARTRFALISIGPLLIKSRYHEAAAAQAVRHPGGNAQFPSRRRTAEHGAAAAVDLDPQAGGRAGRAAVPPRAAG